MYKYKYKYVKYLILLLRKKHLPQISSVAIRSPVKRKSTLPVYACTAYTGNKFIWRFK